MDRRHFPNSYRVEVDRGRHRNRAMVEQSYTQTGRAAVPENGPLVHQMNNLPRGGYHRTTHWNSETNEHHSSSSIQVSHVQQSFSGPSYDPFSQSSENEYLPPQNNSSHYNRYHSNHNQQDSQDSATRNRGALKRKGPETSGSEVNSSSHRFYGSGSSSSSFEVPNRKMSSHIDYGHSEVHHGNSNFFAGEGSSRSTRRRLTLDLEANSMPAHISNYSSNYHHPPNHYPPHMRVEHGNLNGVGSNQNWNFGTHGAFQAAGASGSSHGNNPLFMRGCGPEIRNYPRAPVQGSRGRRNSHSFRERPQYNADPSYFSANNYSSRTSQSARGWGNSYSIRTSGAAIERFHSIASVADGHGRIGSEDLMMELPHFYANSHIMFDQHRDMRLDIDDMSYEELLALGESIGNVNIGLSSDAISLSLTEEAYSSVQKKIEESCAICLEEYVNGVAIGSMKNCGHSYHANCIKKWMSMKNVCPICKAPARKDGLN